MECPYYQPWAVTREGRIASGLNLVGWGYTLGAYKPERHHLLKLPSKSERTEGKSTHCSLKPVSKYFFLRWCIPSQCSQNEWNCLLLLPLHLVEFFSDETQEHRTAPYYNYKQYKDIGGQILPFITLKTFS